MTDTGNAAQVRVVAEQLFEIWKSEQASESGKARASWPAWLGLVLGALAIVFSAGSLRSDVATANTRLDKLEQRSDGRDADERKMMDRLARIETKLDLALDQQKGEAR